MAADSYGNDVTLVGVPVTGFVAAAPAATARLSATAGAVKPLTLNAAYKKVGLIAEDGGPEWELKPDGDALVFWQDGYSIPTGLATATVTITAAETNAWVRELISGKTPDANGYIVIDAGGNATRYLGFIEEVFKNSKIRRREFLFTVGEAKESKSKRGEVTGYELTLNIAYDTTLGGHIAEWVV